MKLPRIILALAMLAGSLAAQVPDTLRHSIPAPFGGAQSGAQLGSSVAVDGDLTVAGASLDDIGGFDSGVVKVFHSATGALLHVIPNPAPDSGAYGDAFGSSVAISGMWVVVGAHGDDMGTDDAGRAYVYDLSSATPTIPVATLNNPDPQMEDYFGWSVAISGTRVVVGAIYDDTVASTAGRAYVYDLSSGTPTVPVATLDNPVPDGGDCFGSAVAISGARVVVGAFGDGTGGINAGSAYVYDLASGTPTLPVATLNNPDPALNDFFGNSVAISGTRVVVGAANDDTGAEDAGSAYVYDMSSGTPTVPVATLNNPGPVASDFFGYSVAIAGLRVVVGAFRDDTGASNAGSAYVYDLGSGTPTVPVATLNNPDPAVDDRFGISVAIAGTRVVIGAYLDDTGASDAGSAYVYDLGSGTPTVPVATLNNPSPASLDSFGNSVAISGTRMVVGAPYDDTGASDAGSAYVYDLASGTPTVPVATLNNPGPAVDDQFGRSVAISETRVVVGAQGDDTGASNAGSAYVYDLASGTPAVPVATLNNPGPAAGDQFGYAVAIDGTTTIIGTPFDGTVMVNKGYAYVFTPEFTPPAGGTLTLSPATPVDASAALTVTFAGWTDASLPLSYEVLVDNVIVSPAGPTASRNLTGPSAAGAHTLKGRIYDAVGNFSEVTQSFQVLSATLSSWQQTQLGGTGPGTGLTESFTGDGIANLLKFGFGMDPTVAGGPALQYTGTFAGGGTVAANGMPTTAFESTESGLDFRALFVRRTDYLAAGLVYTPVFSPDLLLWEASAETPTVLADDGTYQVVSVPYPLSIGGKKAKFFKLQLSLAP